MVTAKSKIGVGAFGQRNDGGNVVGAAQRRGRIEAGKGVVAAPGAFFAREDVEADFGQRRGIGGEERIALMDLRAGCTCGIGDLRVLGGDQDAREAAAFNRRIDGVGDDRPAEKRQHVLPRQAASSRRAPE